MSPQSHIDVVLRDGKSMRIRPITPEDVTLLEEFFYRLSPRTRYMRFQYTKTYISKEELYNYTHVTPPAQYAYVGTMRDTGADRIVAVGRWYQTTDPERAEVSFVMEDTIQVKGLGTVLLEQLAESAMKYKIKTFIAAVLPENVRMREVFEDCGFVTKKVLEEGIIYITIFLDQKEEYTRKSAYREHVARSAGVVTMLYPKTVAVIGASKKASTVGGAVFRNILEADFTGTVFPVNPSAVSIGGVMAYPSVLDIPVEVDLAVIIVPAAHVPDVVADCGKKGVKGIVIISAGFGETGAEGKALQERVMQEIVGHGMRLIGPNCLGVLNFDPAVRLNATFSPLSPPPGRISISTQSGALGLALIDYARSLDLGVAQFVSIGNRADISSVDLLEFWEDDALTELILIYEEAFGNPRKFARTARRVSRVKPIIAVKAGRSEVGAKAASSHTGALAASDVAVDALFREAGVIRANTIEEMFNVARGMVDQPWPRGNRVGILTNAGGPGVLTADACEGWGLAVTPLAPETRAAMKEYLPAAAATLNPVDIIASASPEHYKRTLNLMIEDPNIDSIIIIYIAPLVTQPQDVASAIKEALADYKGAKPVFACFMMLHQHISDITVANGRRIPMFTFPEDAVQALARSWQYYQYRTQEQGKVTVFEDIDEQRARKEAFSVVPMPTEPGWLMPEVAATLLAQYGIEVVTTRAAMSADEAATIADGLGYPVVVKLRSNTIVHKTDVKGLVLNIQNADEVRAAYEAITAALKEKGLSDQMQGVIVQPMTASGNEVIVGMVNDPLFGPLIMCGMGGVLVEIMKDVAFSLHPLRDIDPERMLGQLRGRKLLEGWRGAEPSDIEALKEVLLRFSAMIEDFPEIEQVEINPLIVRTKGCQALDFRIRINPQGV